MLRSEVEKNTRMPTTYTIDPLFVNNRLTRLPGSNQFMLNQAATEALQMPKDGKIVERGVINP